MAISAIPRSNRAATLLLVPESSRCAGAIASGVVQQCATATARSCLQSRAIVRADDRFRRDDRVGPAIGIGDEASVGSLRTGQPLRPNLGASRWWLFAGCVRGLADAYA
jgi:hypothetical protein